MGAKRKFSTVIDRDEHADGKKGVRPYNREQIYQWLYDNSDHRGIVIFTQREVAKRLELSYQYVCNLYAEFVETGMMAKHGPRSYEVVYHADEVEWDKELRAEHSDARKAYQPYYKNKESS